MPDPGPLARLEAVVARPETASVVFQRLTDAEAPETLREIAKAWGLPAGRFVEWYTTEHAAQYDAALKVLADQHAHEIVAIADEQKQATDSRGNTFDPDVARDKLRMDARRWVAGRWDRSRYGDQVQHQISGRAVLKVDFSRPGEREVEGVVEPAEISAVDEI